MLKVDVSKIATLTGHKDCIYALEKTDSDAVFYSSGGDGMVVKWDLNHPEEGELVIQAQNSVYALHFLDDQQELVLGENFEGIHSVNVKEKKEAHSSAITTSSIFDIQSTQNLLIAGTGDGQVIVLDKKDLSTIIKLKLSDRSARCIAINSVKNQAAVGFSDHSVRIIDLSNFSVIYTLPAHENSVFTVTYSPDGNYLLTGSRDAHLKVWKVNNEYKLENSIVAHMYAINHIVYSPDGKYFATCSMDKAIKLWDAKEFKLLKVIDKARHSGHGTSVNKLLWSKYENTLISCSDDRTISLWRIEFN